MERTILFKAKKLSDGEWVEGSLVTSSQGTFIATEEDTSVFPMTMDEVDPSTICQFTGLKDKKGADVYEGDYLSSIYDYPKLKKVVFKNGSFGLDMYYRGLDFVPLACCDIRAGELVEFVLSDRKEGEK